MPYDQVQFTLVDCPGHATLMKTVLGGAHIIDMMVLVIDVNKGMQTQTAECLVVGEITTHDLLVVLNKIDMIPEKMRFERIEKVKARLRSALKPTKFRDCKFISVAARPGGADGMEAGGLPPLGKDAPFVIPDFLCKNNRRTEPWYSTWSCQHASLDEFWIKLGNADT